MVVVFRYLVDLLMHNRVFGLKKIKKKEWAGGQATLCSSSNNNY